MSAVAPAPPSTATGHRPASFRPDVEGLRAIAVLSVLAYHAGLPLITGGYAGGQAEYVRVPMADVAPMKVPDGMDDESVLFLTDILPTGWQGAEHCEIQGGETIAVWGAGPVGIFAIQSAKIMGAERIIAIETVPERIALAKKAGAGTGLLIVAGVMALYASFFFFFFLAELLDEWVWRWLAFLIVFLILVAVTLIAAFVGYLFFKRVRGPAKTIETVNELPTVLPHRGAAHDTTTHPRIPPAREG